MERCNIYNECEFLMDQTDTHAYASFGISTLFIPCTYTGAVVYDMKKKSFMCLFGRTFDSGSKLCIGKWTYGYWDIGFISQNI